MALTEAERSERMLRGLATLVDNCIGWARTYLKKARLIERTRRQRGHDMRSASRAVAELVLMACTLSCAGKSELPPAPTAAGISSASTSGSVFVIATEAETGRPARYANVVVLGMRKGGMTDESGTFLVPEIPPGLQRIKMYAPGRSAVVHAVTVAAGRIDTLRVKLKRGPIKPITIEPVEVR